MSALFDVNVLIALLDADHSLHAQRVSSGCPDALPVRTVIDRLAEANAGALHEFWPDDISLLDAQVADPARIHGPRQITDLYLLALAVRHAGRFVTFDASVSLDAVVGAEKKHLLAL